MAPQTPLAVLTLLAAGLLSAAFGTLFLVKPGAFEAIASRSAGGERRKLGFSLLAAGVALLTAAAFEVVSYPYSRPFLVVMLSVLLPPLALLGIAAATLRMIILRLKG